MTPAAEVWRWPRLRRGGGDTAAGAIAAAGPDLKAARPDFEAAGPDFEAAGPGPHADPWSTVIVGMLVFFRIFGRFRKFWTCTRKKSH